MLRPLIVGILVQICPHTRIYLSAYSYICVKIQGAWYWDTCCMCPHNMCHVSSHWASHASTPTRMHASTRTPIYVRDRAMLQGLCPHRDALVNVSHSPSDSASEYTCTRHVSQDTCTRQHVSQDTCNMYGKTTEGLSKGLCQRVTKASPTTK